MPQYITTIDADTGRVDLPMNMSLDWFDKFRQGYVGVITLIPAEDGDGCWTLFVQEAPDVVQAAVAAAEREEDDEE
jgi:hypothetical protein